MGCTIEHEEYLAAPALEDLLISIEAHWEQALEVDVFSFGDKLRIDIPEWYSTWITIERVDGGFLATITSQEKRTGYREDQEEARQVWEENKRGRAAALKTLNP